MLTDAISLWEPWASLMRVGAKAVETRSWRTNRRGPLLICGAKRWCEYQNQFLHSPAVQRAFMRCAGRAFTKEDMLFGKAGCIVYQTGCVPTELVAPAIIESEGEFGNYAPNRYAWTTDADRRIVFDPFPVRGMQMIFHVEVPDAFRELLPRPRGQL